MSDWKSTPWKLIYDSWQPERQPLREALCTLGNGNFATRGAAEEAVAGGPHYPGTYVAGGYNRLATDLAGRTIVNEDLVNWPNWLCLTFRHEGEAWFDLAAVDILEFYQELDLQQGILQRSVQFRDQQGRESTLVSRRLVHASQPNLAAIQWNLLPENWSGMIEVRSALDGTVKNEGVARYRDLESQHLEPLETGPVDDDGIYLLVQTNQSRMTMAQAARLWAFDGSERLAIEARIDRQPGWIAQHATLPCREGNPLRLEKTVGIYTSRDHAISEPGRAAHKAIRRAETFDGLRHSHELGWSRLWDRCDIRIDGPTETQLTLRLHIFHLLQSCSMNTVYRDVGVPARGWHGEAYRGHIFWDELFVFPFLNLRIPELTRELLMYRYRRLNEARHAAQEAGYRGAMFPWQSGSSGREESQVLHLNPKSGRWVSDNSWQQRHVNAAIAYNVWQYYQATGDIEFMSFYGAELLLEVARFWASIAEYDSRRDRFVIRSVMGPDEFHTKYPDREELGLDNNAYTNVMAVWVICRALECLELLAPFRRKELLNCLELDQQEMDRWDHVSRRMFVPFHGEGILSQFEGYETLESFPWQAYEEKYDDIQRLDRILEAEGDTINRYQAGKQADVLMLFYLFSMEQLANIFDRLGYDFTPEMIPRTIEYYETRTSHGSTLSRVVHSWVLARSHREAAWKLFAEALESDVSDIQGGTTAEGIHLGAMAGTVDVMQRCFTGIEMHRDVLWLNPSLPKVMSHITCRVRYRGHWLCLEFSNERVKVSCAQGGCAGAKIGFGGRVYTIESGETQVFRLESQAVA